MAGEMQVRNDKDNPLYVTAEGAFGVVYAKPQKWEYMIAGVGELDKMGHAGWEAVCALEGKGILFKRPDVR